MEALAQTLADALARELSLEKKDRDIAAYALHGLFSITFYTGIVLTVSWLAGIIVEAAVVALTFGIFRTFMGGAHLATAWRCGITGAVAVTSLGFAARVMGESPLFGQLSVQGWTIVAFFLLAWWAIGRYCPADVPQKPISNPVHRRNLRMVSRGLLLLWAAAATLAARNSLEPLFWSFVLALALQLLMVTPAGFRCCAQVDKLSVFLHRRGGADPR